MGGLELPTLRRRTGDQAIEVADQRGGVNLALAYNYRALAMAQISVTDPSLASLTLAKAQVEELSESDRDDSVFCFSQARWRFCHGRILSYLGMVDEAWAIHDEALATYPASVVGDTTLIYLDRAISFIRNGDLHSGIDLAARAFDDLPPEHRTDLFVRATQRVIAAVAPSDRDAEPVRGLRELVRTASTLA